jgi:hypothetical protein
MLVINEVLIRQSIFEHPVVFDSLNHTFVVGAGYSGNKSNHTLRYHFHGFIYSLKVFQKAKTE